MQLFKRSRSRRLITAPASAPCRNPRQTCRCLLAEAEVDRVQEARLTEAISIMRHDN